MQVCNLADLDLHHRAEFGGKAAHLGHAARLGCPVLGGVALSVGLFQRFAEQGGLLGEVASILSTMQPRTMPQFQAAAWAISSAFRVRRLPDEVRAALLSAWEQVGAPRVGVRSSATNEDSPNRSFVGQHASTLDIDSPDALVAAAMESWNSLFSAKALAYAHRFGVDLLASGMGLIVQPMLQAEARGALFTVDPITGDPDRFILEIRQGSERGVFDLDPYGRKPGELSYWSQLRYYGLLLDEHDLAYQAIEWAISEGALYFLRVRPATAVPRYLPARERPARLAQPVRLLADPDVPRRALPPYSRYHLSRAGPAESAPERALWPLPNEPAQIEVLGYLYRGTDAGARSPGVELGALRLLAQGLRDMLASGRLDQDRQLEVAALDERLHALHSPTFSDLTDAELADHLADVQRVGDGLVSQELAIAETIASLRDLLDQMRRRWAHVDANASLLVAPVTPPGPSAAPPTLTELLQRDILAEPIDDESTAASGDLLQAAAASAPVAELGLMRRPLVAALLGRWRRLQALLDEALAITARARLREREAVLEIGHRLHAAGIAASDTDVALLEARELERWLRGEIRDEQVMRWVIKRREAQRRAWRYAPPEELPAPPNATDADLAACELVLKGRAVAAGVVVGRARVIRSLGETSAVLPGEVLVCHQATFELSPLFSAVAALVAETGTLLDSGSVLVREYGLPSVFAVAQATEQIRTGDELVVDAVRGRVGRRRVTPGARRYILGELDFN